jgi:hypothetical protein
VPTFASVREAIASDAEARGDKGAVVGTSLHAPTNKVTTPARTTRCFADFDPIVISVYDR